MFDAEEAAHISSIPVSKLGAPDVLIWHYDNKGVYTVMSGYKLLCNNEKASEGSSRRVFDGCWSKIWRIKVPTKIQIFLWRIMHDILPVKVNLANRRIPINHICTICELEVENCSMLLEIVLFHMKFGNNLTGIGIIS